MTNEIYKTLIGTELSAHEHACLSTISRAKAPLAAVQVAQATKPHPLFARRALRALVSRKILIGASAGGSRIYDVNSDVKEWK